MKITIGYTEYDLKFIDYLYCPFCGSLGIWEETTEGDYYDGPLKYCENCKSDFTLN